MSAPVVDILGVGFGPANLAVAIALEERGFTGSLLFCDAQRQFSWQPGMLLRGSDIQHNPLRDLITLVNPRSQYGFVSYLHQTGRMFEYLNLGLAFPLRREFAAYVEWVAAHFTQNVEYGVTVTGLRLIRDPAAGELFEVTAEDGSRRLARSLVVAPGRSRNVPEVFRPVLGPRVFHLCDYLPHIAAAGTPRAVAVIGGSQSAVEIMLDLDGRFPEAELFGITRSHGYRMKDVSPFTGEAFFPEFTEYFHSASWQSRLQLSAELRATNYGAADADVIQRLYLRRYESRFEGWPHHINLVKNARVVQCETASGRVLLRTADRHNGAERCFELDAVVLATGFLDHGTGGQRELMHPLLHDLAHRYLFDRNHGFAVARDYSLVCEGAPPVYLNGLCESTHGFGDAGSFSLLSLRAAEIAASIIGRLAVEQRRPAPVRAERLKVA